MSRVPLRTPVRRGLLAFAILLLLLLAWGALSGAWDQFPRSQTVGQRVETGVQIVVGLLSPLVVLTCFGWRPWARGVRIAWTISLASAAGLSALVWGPPMPLLALLFASVAALAGWMILWMLRATSGARGRPLPGHGEGAAIAEAGR